MSCPTDNVLAELVDGTLAPDERTAVEQHLDHCPICTQLVTELANVIAPPPPAPRGYRLLRMLDDDVWEAEADGDQRVAISFGARCDTALVTVRDPHVVRVEAVGELGGRGYVVHEIVTTTERMWRGRTRTRAEVIAVWQAALAGLAALHRSNITLALSPDHVFVEDDGRVHVGGFAHPLARTSGYLAPERLQGGEPTMRADQFSACVAIWEALTGERPFSGATPGALAVSTTVPPIATDDRMRVLLHGLAHDPADRWPDVAALAAAFASPPKSRRVAIAIAVVAALAAIVVGYLSLA